MAFLGYALLVLAALGAGASGAGGVLAERGHRAPAERAFTTAGVIKSFGPARTFVNIAHDDIPGYMAAMTMAFEPRNAAQLSGLAAGDKVTLAFTETDDGRRLLDRITRR